MASILLRIIRIIFLTDALHHGATNFIYPRVLGIGMDAMKKEFLRMHGYDDWTTDGMGTLICPHGHRCEDDQRDGLGECGCVSPLAQENFI